MPHMPMSNTDWFWQGRSANLGANSPQTDDLNNAFREQYSWSRI